MSLISRMLCRLTMWRGFSPGWSLTSRALYASSMGESRLEKSPWKKRKTSRKEVKTERDDLITKQEMESALSVMKIQIVEEIRWAIACVRISATCIYVWYQSFLITRRLREGFNEKKTFSFGHCPNHLNPPPDPNAGNLVLFFGSQNSRFESQFRTKNTIYTIWYTVYMQPKK